MASTKAVFVSSNFPSPAEAPRGSSILEQLSALRELGCSFEVLATRPRFPMVRGRYYRHAGRDSEAVAGFRVWYPRVLYVPLSRGSINGWLYASSLSLMLRRRCAAFQPRFLWSGFLFPDGVGVGRLAAELDLPHVVSVIGSDLNFNRDNDRRMPAIVRCLMGAALVLPKSRALAELVMSCGVPEERVLVVYNGVDHSTFKPRERSAACREVGVPADSKRILFVGNLLPVKNVSVLVAAFDALKRRWAGAPLELVIIGEGFLRTAIEKEVTRRRLGTSVRMLGSRPHHEVALWMGTSDLLCLPSRTEGVPNVVLEALASGRWVVASAVGGVPEIHPGDAAGALVPADDEEALAHALLRTLSRPSDPDRISRMAEAYSWRANATRLLCRLAQLGLVDDKNG